MKIMKIHRIHMNRQKMSECPLGQNKKCHAPWLIRHFPMCWVEVVLPFLLLLDGATPQADLIPRRILSEGKTVTIWGRLLNGSYASFQSIPYAESPTGNLRFQRPSLHILERDFQAVNAPSPCPQLNENGEFIGDENCLMLSIYVPHPQPKSLLPVLVWFHGEREQLGENLIFQPFSSGSASDLDVEVWMQEGSLVIVTPQYRLGSLGFLSTATFDGNGNMGLFDKVMALEWVQRHISAFGGNANSVAIMGQGQAAMSIGHLATTQRGLFHRVILMNGSPLSPMAIDPTPQLTFTELAQENGCGTFPTTKFIRCMQNKKVEDIVAADKRLAGQLNAHFGRKRIPLPVIQKEDDGRFLPPLIFRNPSITLEEGSFEDVPLIIGISERELRGFLSSFSGKIDANEIDETILSSKEVLRNFIRGVVGRNFAEADLVADMITFEYFSGLNITKRKEQAKDILEDIFSDHLLQIPSIKMARLWSKTAPVYFFVHEGKGHELLKGNLGQIVVSLWKHFIHTGSPLNSGTDWPNFTDDNNGNYLILEEGLGVGSGYRYRQHELWERLIPSLEKRVCPKQKGRASLRSGRYPQIFQDVSEVEASKKFFTPSNTNFDLSRK